MLRALRSGRGDTENQHERHNRNEPTAPTSCRSAGIHPALRRPPSNAARKGKAPNKRRISHHLPLLGPLVRCVEGTPSRHRVSARAFRGSTEVGPLVDVGSHRLPHRELRQPSRTSERAQTRPRRQATSRGEQPNATRGDHPLGHARRRTERYASVDRCRGSSPAEVVREAVPRRPAGEMSGAVSTVPPRRQNTANRGPISFGGETLSA